MEEWTPDVGPELSEMKVGVVCALYREERVEVAVAEIVQDAAMKLVGTGLRDEADLPACGSAGIRSVSTRRNLELGDRFGGELKPEL